MTRYVNIAAAQMGPVSQSETRSDVVERLLAMMRDANVRGCDLVVFPECALVPFFPHWFLEDPEEIDAYFEREMPGPETKPLFDEAKRLGVGFHLGYAELAVENGQTHHYNSSVLVGKDGRVIGHYRKIHLPGHADHRPKNLYQNLEKRYFEVGNLGFNVWRGFGGVVGMLICNDRRWAESYRVLALQGVELVLLGYNTPTVNPETRQVDKLTNFHNQLSMQAGAYQNATWVVGVAKAGCEAGVDQIGQSMIIAPSGEVTAMSTTLADELVIGRCDLDLATHYKQHVFNFARNRRIEHYGLIGEQTEARPPED